MGIRYINTDLDIESTQSLQPIIDAFGDDAFVLYHERYQDLDKATLEASPDQPDPDAVVQHFYTLVQSLRPEAKTVWDQCISKVFDLGYEAAPDDPVFNQGLQATTLQRLAELGASLKITAYRQMEGG